MKCCEVLFCAYYTYGLDLRIYVGGFFYGYFELKRRFFMKCYYYRFYYEILLIINFDFFFFILV